jgi:hypothetical protein
LASDDRTAERQGQDEEERKEGDDEGKGLDIVGARRSVLHAITPGPIGPLPIDEA